MIEVTVLVADDHLATIDAVAAALERAGLQLGETLPAGGVITGTTSDPAALEGVAGVAAVERARELRIAPPDAPVQ